MLLTGVFDLLLLVVLIFLVVKIIRAARRLVASRPVAEFGPVLAPALPRTVESRLPREPRRRVALSLAVIAAMLAAASAIILVIASSLGAFGPVISAPSTREAVGTWVGSGGARLVLNPDGTFTASHLPAGIGDWGGVNPASGGGTWHVGRFDPSTPQGVIFNFSNGDQVELQVERDRSSLAMFYDLGDPDQGWSGQYRFVKR